MPLTSDQMPKEGNSVFLFGSFGKKLGYLLEGVWYEAVDGQDLLIEESVTSWEPKTDD